MTSRAALMTSQQPGTTGSSAAEQQYVEYIPGSVPIILSVPHGGYLEPTDIPDRSERFGRITTTPDLFTIELASSVANAIEDNLEGGGRPHLVISNLIRAKLDVNREVQEATQAEVGAVAAYNLYHSHIRQARERMGGRGILFDIHGQGHMQNSTEVGYVLSKEDLNAMYYDADKSSVRNLAKRSGLSCEDLAVGEQSLGGFLEREGYNAVPSPRQKYPGQEKYFSGGYTTKRHGSMCGGNMDAIQLETPKEERVEGGEERRERFAKALGAAIAKFYSLHYS